MPTGGGWALGERVEYIPAAAIASPLPAPDPPSASSSPPPPRQHHTVVSGDAERTQLKGQPPPTAVGSPNRPDAFGMGVNVGVEEEPWAPATIVSLSASSRVPLGTAAPIFEEEEAAPAVVAAGDGSYQPNLEAQRHDGPPRQRRAAGEVVTALQAHGSQGTLWVASTRLTAPPPPSHRPATCAYAAADVVASGGVPLTRWRVEGRDLCCDLSLNTVADVACMAVVSDPTPPAAHTATSASPSLSGGGGTVMFRHQRMASDSGAAAGGNDLLNGGTFTTSPPAVAAHTGGEETLWCGHWNTGRISIVSLFYGAHERSIPDAHALAETPQHPAGGSANPHRRRGGPPKSQEETSRPETVAAASPAAALTGHTAEQRSGRDGRDDVEDSSAEGRWPPLPRPAPVTRHIVAMPNRSSTMSGRVWSCSGGPPPSRSAAPATSAAGGGVGGRGGPGGLPPPGSSTETSDEERSASTDSPTMDAAAAIAVIAIWDAASRRCLQHLRIPPAVRLGDNGDDDDSRGGQPQRHHPQRLGDHPSSDTPHHHHHDDHHVFEYVTSITYIPMTDTVWVGTSHSALLWVCAPSPSPLSTTVSRSDGCPPCTDIGRVARQVVPLPSAGTLSIAPNEGYDVVLVLTSTHLCVYSVPPAAPSALQPTTPGAATSASAAGSTIVPLLPLGLHVKGPGDLPPLPAPKLVRLVRLNAAALSIIPGTSSAVCLLQQPETAATDLPLPHGSSIAHSRRDPAPRAAAASSRDWRLAVVSADAYSDPLVELVGGPVTPFRAVASKLRRMCLLREPTAVGGGDGGGGLALRGCSLSAARTSCGSGPIQFLPNSTFGVLALDFLLSTEERVTTRDTGDEEKFSLLGLFTTAQTKAVGSWSLQTCLEDTAPAMSSKLGSSQHLDVVRTSTASSPMQRTADESNHSSRNKFVTSASEVPIAPPSGGGPCAHHPLKDSCSHGNKNSRGQAVTVACRGNLEDFAETYRLAMELSRERGLGVDALPPGVIGDEPLPPAAGRFKTADGRRIATVLSKLATTGAPKTEKAADFRGRAMANPTAELEAECAAWRSAFQRLVEAIASHEEQLTQARTNERLLTETGVSPDGRGGEPSVGAANGARVVRSSDHLTLSCRRLRLACADCRASAEGSSFSSTGVASPSISLAEQGSRPPAITAAAERLATALRQHLMKYSNSNNTTGGGGIGGGFSHSTTPPQRKQPQHAVTVASSSASSTPPPPGGPSDRQPTVVTPPPFGPPPRRGTPPPAVPEASSLLPRIESRSTTFAAIAAREYDHALNVRREETIRHCHLYMGSSSRGGGRAAASSSLSESPVFGDLYVVREVCHNLRCIYLYAEVNFLLIAHAVLQRRSAAAASVATSVAEGTARPHGDVYAPARVDADDVAAVLERCRVALSPLAELYRSWEQHDEKLPCWTEEEAEPREAAARPSAAGEAVVSFSGGAFFFRASPAEQPDPALQLSYEDVRRCLHPAPTSSASSSSSSSSVPPEDRFLRWTWLWVTTMIALLESHRFLELPAPSTPPARPLGATTTPARTTTTAGLSPPSLLSPPGANGAAGTTASMDDAAAYVAEEWQFSVNLCRESAAALTVMVRDVRQLRRLAAVLTTKGGTHETGESATAASSTSAPLGSGGSPDRYADADEMDQEEREATLEVALENISDMLAPSAGRRDRRSRELAMQRLSTIANAVKSTLSTASTRR